MLIKPKESVELKTLKQNEKHAEHHNPLKPPKAHTFYVRRIKKQENM